MDMQVFLQKERIFQAPLELAQPLLAPELRTRNFTDTRIFLICELDVLPNYTSGKKKEPKPNFLVRISSGGVGVFTCIRKAPDTFNFLRHVMRASWSVRPKCSHRCVSLKETPLKPVKILKHRTKNSTEQTVMTTKWFKHIAI